MELRETIRLFVVDNFLFGDDRGLKWDSSFLGEAIIDSTGILELVTFLESKFAICVADNEMIPENLDSINKVAAFLERRGEEAFSSNPHSHMRDRVSEIGEPEHATNSLDQEEGF